jgi:hypothetical protein
MMSKPQYFGLYRGAVTSTADPANRHRVQVTVPFIGIVGAWALPCVPYGKSVVAPPVGEVVWIMFEQGDANSPVWLGWSPGPH